MSNKKSLIAAGIAFLVVAVLGTAIAFAQQHRDGWGPGSRFGGPDRDHGFGMMDGDGYGRGDNGRGGYGNGYGPGDMMGNGYGNGYGPGDMMGGSYGGGYGMMGGSYGIAGNGAVSTLAEALTAAQRYADTLGLRVGEVMQFTENFYAELKKPDGALATEVLIDPGTGAVRIENGPAMMWNTEYGMMRSGSSGPETVTPAQARKIANDWLAKNRNGETAGTPDVFPGYYTLHSTKGDTITGMLSVNAYTGAVWYHTWHGEFVSMSES